MHNHPSTSYELAVRDFQRARKSAVLRQVLARLRGHSADLLDYEAICQQLKSTERSINRGLEEILVYKIVGSVGRYQDFTRDFLPKQQSDETRWAKVKAAMTDMAGLPPIEVYQIGDAYFVLDGNHRVSVARKLGTETIAAYVTEIQTRVPLSVDDDPDEVICKARYAHFLDATNLDRQVPDIDLLMTVAGHYQTLVKQIDLQHQRLIEEAASESNQPSSQDAAFAWYESAYLPIINIVRDLGVMRRFPKRTETDIYVLLCERREELELALGWHLELGEALPTLVQEEAETQTMSGARVGARALGYIDKMVRPAMVGSWRMQQLAMHREGRLFADLLVLFEGIDEDWELLEAAIALAASDHDRVLGLHIVHDPSQFEHTAVREMKARFHERCRSAGLVGEFAVEAGDGATVLLKRAAWSDLLLINLTSPPESNVLARLRSFWGPVITRCPRPLLIAPHAKFNGMAPMLLSYDGSPKADEALFVATYNASRWGHALTVLTVETPHTRPDALAKARDYLEKHEVSNATYFLKEGPIGEAIIETAAERQCSVIVMGGFGATPTMRLLRGSAVEYVLQHAVEQAVMICQ